jgi:hypothetical protein
MAKGGRPDKENMIVGMFSKIAREYDRQRKREIRDAKRKGEFYYINNPELLSIEEQEKYFKAKDIHEGGGDQYRIIYRSENRPMPYHFMTSKDK